MSPHNVVEFFKKRPVLLWIGAAILIVGAYLIGKRVQGTSTDTSQSPPIPGGTFNTYYVQATQPTTDTTAQPLPSDTTPTPLPMPIDVSTLFHPAGIVDSTSAPPSHTSSTYTIKAGDTLASIAARLGITVNQLYNANRGTLSRASKQHGGGYYDTGRATKSPPAGLKLYAGTTLSTTP